MPLRHVLLRTRSSTSILSAESIHCEGEEAWVLKCLLYLDGIEVARKGILIRCSGMVRYLYPASLLHWVMVEVDIASFVEAVVRGLV